MILLLRTTGMLQYVFPPSQALYKQVFTVHFGSMNETAYNARLGAAIVEKTTVLNKHYTSWSFCTYDIFTFGAS